MSDAWITIIALAVATAALRAAGPVFLGGRSYPPRVWAVMGLIAPAVLGALVVTQSLGESASIVLDERLAGLAAAAAAVVMRAPMLAVLVIAAAATAIVRLAL
jgi:uncharacterized membrane protein